MSNNPSGRRRTFLKQIGGLGAAGAGLSLAGCTGDGGDGGGDGDGGDGGGGDGGGDGDDGGGGDDGGDGGDGGSTNGGETELEQISLTVPAAPWPAAVANYLQDSETLDDHLGSAGYTYEMEITYGGPPLFASGESDIAGLGATEASIMAATREFNVVIPGQTYIANGVLAVRTDSEFDPEVAGSQEAAMQTVADEGRFGIGGWEGGDVQIFGVLFPEVFDLEFREEGGDFEVLSTGDYATLPQLILDEEIDIGDIVMTLNGFPHFMSDPPRLTSLAFVPDLMRENGFNPDAYGGIVAMEDFAEENPDALEAYVEAWQEGVDWFYDDPTQAIDEYRDIFPGVENDEQVEWIADFALGETDVGDTPLFYDPVALQDDWIDEQERFLDLAASRGDLPEDWADYVEFRQL